MKKFIAFLFTISILSTTLLKAQKTDTLPSRVYSWSSLTTKKESTRIIRPVLEGSTTSLARFEVHSSTLEPGKAPHAPHTHNDWEELIIVKEGRVKITIKGASKVLGRGSIAFVMPGDEHDIQNVGDIQATYYILTYKSKLPPNPDRAKQNGGSFMMDWNDIALKKNEKGARRDFFNKPTSQLEKFEMHTTALNAGLDSHAPHTHKEEEIILILKGNVKMYIAGELHAASPGDVVFLSSGVSHALKNTGTEQSEYFAFQWRN
ncbi:MAG TPA: cupin domain-containing protein [Flavitalea sp.]|nr:cupin domain-containing protein [Flavitalea sp.]